MIVVTGGAGMIGSNIVRGLNQRGLRDILVVDDLKEGSKFVNLADLDITDYMDKEDFLAHIMSDVDMGDIEAIFHEGACSSTTERDGNFLMANNYQYSKTLLHYCLDMQIPFLYASSAAVYGGRNAEFIELRQYERPLNAYGYSKMLFDHYVRQVLPVAESQVCGLRYFNVYGPREGHKGEMSSVAFHLNSQLKNGEKLKLFEGSDQFKRDFIHVDDVVTVNLWFWEQGISGIFNCGTGKPESFQAVADAVIKYYKEGQVQMVPFPEKLKGCYQTYTCADLTRLREAGYDKKFKPVSQGVEEYLIWLHSD